MRYTVVKVMTRDPYFIFKSCMEEIKRSHYKATWLLVFCRKMSDLRAIYNYFHISLKMLYSHYTNRPSATYHSRTQEEVKDFITSSFNDDNCTIRFLVATIAFGMGVDCKGLHNIIHFGPPSTLDDYFQESERAGRDGLLSNAHLIVYPKALVSKNITKETYLLLQYEP